MKMEVGVTMERNKTICSSGGQASLVCQWGSQTSSTPSNDTDKNSITREVYLEYRSKEVYIYISFPPSLSLLNISTATACYEPPSSINIIAHLALSQASARSSSQGLRPEVGDAPTTPTTRN